MAEDRRIVVWEANPKSLDGVPLIPALTVKPTCDSGCLHISRGPDHKC